MGNDSWQELCSDLQFPPVCSFSEKPWERYQMLLGFTSSWTQRWIKLAQLRLFLSYLLVDIGKIKRNRGGRKSNGGSTKKIFCLQLLPFQSLEKQTRHPETVSCLWAKNNGCPREACVYLKDIYLENEHFLHFVF